MKMLTWRQPFASLMLHGKVETRTWATNYRGEVLIHAGKSSYKFDEMVQISGLDNMERIFRLIPTGTLYKRGVALAVAELVDCRLMTKADEEATFVKYDPAVPRFCHVYKNVRPIEQFELQGCQGWGNVSEEIKAKIKFL